MTRFSLRLKIGRITIWTQISKTQTLIGYTSRKYGTRLHYPFFDLDNCSLEEAEIEISRIQKKYDLGEFEIHNDSKGSFRAICKTTVDFPTYVRMLAECKFLDFDFLIWTIRRGEATIRISDKKNRPPNKVVSVIKSKKKIEYGDKFYLIRYDTGTDKKVISVSIGD